MVDGNGVLCFPEDQVYLERRNSAVHPPAITSSSVFCGKLGWGLPHGRTHLG